MLFILELSFDNKFDFFTQFDQAGICIRLDSEHWLKTGIEVVDEKPRLSCVVTNGYSDWSTQSWPESRLRIRVTIKVKCRPPKKNKLKRPSFVASSP